MINNKNKVMCYIYIVSDVLYIYIYILMINNKNKVDVLYI